MNYSKTTMLLLLGMSLITACTASKNQVSKVTPPAFVTNEVRLSSEINWQKLNPARGDKSPQAGTIWGDRNGKAATGFLAKFVDGFSSPAHIHNVTYRAVVLEGLVHNDDENADEMWMPPGSFWTQPAGAPHITSAKGQVNIAYVEIDSAPYLVKPTSEAFDNGERPVNIDARNLVWLGAGQTSIIPDAKGNESAFISFLWQNGQTSGYMLKLLPDFNGALTSEGEEFRAVVIQGELDYTIPNTKESKRLDPGSYFSSQGESVHPFKANSTSETVVYLRTNGQIKLQ